MRLRPSLVAALLLVLVAPGPVPARVSSWGAPGVPPGPVSVAIAAPSMRLSEPADREQLRDRVTHDVQAVVTDLPPTIHVERTFDGLPMFVATVADAGLAALAAQPSVRSITADFPLRFQLDE